MSRVVLNAILNETQVWLNETEREQLYHELIAYFGLVGATNECEALENAWKDSYNKRKIEGFIKAWLERRKRRKAEP
ncbi:MAG: hypothetical protein QXR45_15705 [Candidatus Bathyarchaeia archaeon]